MTPIEKIQLWRCPVCYRLTMDSHHKHGSIAGIPNSHAGKPITYVPLDQVLERLELAAMRADATSSGARRECNEQIEKSAAAKARTLRRFASELKGAE